jgi:hemerythrin-like domain-containing protein
MQRAAEGLVTGQEELITDLLESLAAYLSMLRRHINIEDHIFYPMADKALTDKEKEMLLVEFERADKKAGEGFLDDFRDRILKMEALLTKV